MVELPGRRGGVSASSEAWQQVWRCSARVECRPNQSACRELYSYLYTFHYDCFKCCMTCECIRPLICVFRMNNSVHICLRIFVVNLGYSVNFMTAFTLSLPIPLRLYTLPYWFYPPFLIFDIRVLWRSGLSARASECQTLKMVGRTSMTLSSLNRSNLEQLALKQLRYLFLYLWQWIFVRPVCINHITFDRSCWPHSHYKHVWLIH